jgi:hemolysin III
LPLGKMQNPFRGFLNGAAALVSVAGIVLLVRRAEPGPGRLAAIVFGTGLVALFSASGLYHSVPWNSRWKGIMRRADHSMIFVLIAATFTPFAVVMLAGWPRVASLVAVWLIAVVGISHYAFFAKDQFVWTIGLMVTMGWLGLPLMIPVARAAGVGAVILLAAGGILYTVGMVFLVTGRPRLWPRVFSYHELFHVLVVSASVLHFAAAYRYVAGLSS